MRHPIEAHPDNRGHMNSRKQHFRKKESKQVGEDLLNLR